MSEKLLRPHNMDNKSESGEDNDSIVEANSYKTNCPITLCNVLLENDFKSYNETIPVEFLDLAKSNSIKRILSCFANESYIAAYFIRTSSLIRYVAFFKKPIHNLEGSLWAILKELPIVGNSDPNSSKQETTTLLNGLEEIIPWHVGPIRRITLLHPEDIDLPVYRYKNIPKSGNHNEGYLEQVTHPMCILKHIMEWSSFEKDDIRKLQMEVQNSILNQAHAYQRGFRMPSLLESNIKWEQSTMEGHPTHPINRARLAIQPLLPIPPGTNLDQIKVHFFAVPRCLVIVTGTYEELLKPILLSNSAIYDAQEEVVIPVHEIQLRNIYTRFPFARKLELTLDAEATLSTRTVIIPEFPQINIKLPIGVQLGTVERTISTQKLRIVASLLNILPKITEGVSFLTCVRDLGSVVVKDSEDNAKHFSCMIREDPEQLVKCVGDKAIVSAAFVERSPKGQSVFAIVFGLDTIEKRRHFMELYVKMYIEAFFVPLFEYGVGFEAHMQNVLLRLSQSGSEGELSWVITGFLVRDFDAVFIHAQTLMTKTGIHLTHDEILDFESLTLGEVVRRFTHSTVHLHLQQVIRALGFHYNGEGWAFVRKCIEELLSPEEQHIRALLFENSEVPARCYIEILLNGPGIANNIPVHLKRANLLLTRSNENGELTCN